MTGRVVAAPASQVMAQVLEEHRVETEQSAQGEPTQGAVGTLGHGMSPLLGHSLRPFR